ncbi:MAG: DUF4920 domain-containing protein, partial [Calditrichaeota bacterium]
MKCRFAVVFVLMVVGLVGCRNGEDKKAHSEAEAVPEAVQAALQKADPRGVYGAGVTGGTAVAIADILQHPEQYEGREVVIRGTVSDVCTMQGCWIDVADPASGEAIRVKVKDGEIVFPLSAKGHPVAARGVVERLELTEKQARGYFKHLAEERG